VIRPIGPALGVLALTLLGCVSHKECRDGTVLLSLAFSGGAEDADELDVRVALDMSPVLKSIPFVSHTPGGRSGTLELVVPQYRSHRSIDLEVVLKKAGRAMGPPTQQQIALMGACRVAPLELSLTADGGQSPEPVTDALQDADREDRPAGPELDGRGTEADVSDGPAADLPAAADAVPGRTCEVWKDCVYADACAQSGMRSRSCTDQVCDGGTCTPRTVMEMEPCTRPTDGASCGDRVCGGFDTCQSSSGPCAKSGTWSRMCTDRVCAGGKCTDKVVADTQPCPLDTDGKSCGTTTCTGCNCPTKSCATSATKTCMNYRCSNGACVSSKSYPGCSCTPPCTGPPIKCFVEDTCEGMPCWCPGTQSCFSDCSGYAACVRNGGGCLF
jgi:hypothetical protein